MTEHEEVPYYHTNIPENNKISMDIITRLLNNYGTTEKTFIPLSKTEQEPVVIDKATWADSDLEREYKVERFADDYALTYGSHLMFTTIEHIGDEKEIYTYIFSTSVDDEGYTRINRSRKYSQRTAQHQKEDNERWEKNKRKAGDMWIIVYPDTTDEIAYETELIVSTLQKGETILSRL
jgi:predicted GIY-YIG superfamily endonuclease